MGGVLRGVVVAVSALAMCPVPDACAAARKGGHFVGGTGSHHKGGHEVGGTGAHGDHAGHHGYRSSVLSWLPSIIGVSGRHGGHHGHAEAEQGRATGSTAPAMPAAYEPDDVPSHERPFPFGYPFRFGKWPLDPEAARDLPLPGMSDRRMATIIRKAQVALVAKGYGPCPADGVIARDTREALYAFQFAHRLPQTGRLDTETVRRLEAGP